MTKDLGLGVDNASEEDFFVDNETTIRKKSKKYLRSDVVLLMMRII